ncbi:MAG: glycosyltransferase [Pseudomonadales bacterium]
MHILVIPSWYPNRAGDIGGSFFRTQALALKNYGHKVGVITVQLRSPRQWKSIVRGPFGIVDELDEGIPTKRYLATNWFVRTPYFLDRVWLNYGLKLYESYVNEFGVPDVIHAHSMLYGGYLAGRLSQLYDIPLVVTEHSSFYARDLMSTRQLELARNVSALASATLAVSQSLAEMLARKLGQARGFWSEAPNIVDDTFLHYELPKALDSSGSFCFFGLALLDENKGTNYLIEAFTLAFRGTSNVLLKIGGDGPYRKTLELLVDELGISDQVVFTGMLSRADVVSEMSSSNVVVISSLYETFGVVAIEALALGRPVIATRCGGPESIVQSGDGILVPPGNAEALSEAMLEMFHNSGDYSAEKIRENCRARYSSTVIAGRLSKLYEGLVV